MSSISSDAPPFMKAHDAVATWLKQHDREGYVDAFVNMQSTHPHTFCDVDQADMISLFQQFAPCAVTQSREQLSGLVKGFAEQHFLFRAKGEL